MDQPLLSDLCAICHTEKPKYRCPRCNGQTCSLKCYKRHQQQASCSGKRDPSAYVKKTQLATPAGIDRDYNYLKKVEHTIDGANQDVFQRGIGVEPSSRSKVAIRAWQSDSIFQRYLSENRITVQLAPKGISRQKNNNTRATKNGNVVWTIEWIDSGGGRNLQNDGHATKTIAELYNEIQAQRLNAEKRHLNLEQSNPNHRKPKRKRVESSKKDALVKDVVPSTEDQSSRRIKTEEGVLSANAQESDLNGGSISSAQHDEAHHTNEHPEMKLEMRSDGSLSPPAANMEGDTIKEEPVWLPEVGATSHALTLTNEYPSNSELHYYLLKPGTPGTSCVLIPLYAHSTLTNSLRNEVVQEYPTVYALVDPPESLPTGFLLEEEYERSTKNKIPNPTQDYGDTRTIERENASGTARPPSNDRNAGPELDSKSILDMLKRDIML